MQNKIVNWLDKSGYSFEMRVAEHVRSAGLDPLQSEHYVDPETNADRETDVVAYASATHRDTKLIVAIVFECKVSNEKPWVLLSRKCDLDRTAALRYRACTWYSETHFLSLTERSDFQELGTFVAPQRIGYSLVVAFGSGNQDKAYSALMSVTKATSAIVERIKAESSQNVHVLGLPILAIKGKLFEAFLGDDGDLSLEETSTGVLVWSKPVFETATRPVAPFSMVNVVTEDAFPTFVSALANDAATLADVGAQAIAAAQNQPMLPGGEQ